MNENISLTDYLQQYFGFDRFKGQQEEAVKSVLDGKNIFVLMPTGGVPFYWRVQPLLFPR